MLDALTRFLRSRRSAPDASDPDASPGDEIQVAAAALLVQLAYADGEFTAVERAQIEASLAHHFALDPVTVRDLLALAEAQSRSAIDSFQFTRLINERFDLGQKMLLAEIMWGVALADGRVDDQEAALVRKLAHLLDLQPGYLAAARRAATPAPPRTP